MTETYFMPLDAISQDGNMGSTEEVLEVPLRGVEEISCDLVVVRFMVGDLPDRISIQAKEDRTRVA